MALSRFVAHRDAPAGLPRGRESPSRIGHAHFWDRAMSRGVFLRGAAGVSGAAMTAGMWMPELARAGSKTTSARPRPIPGNPALGGLHVNLPGVNNEPSTIFDFNGHVGIGEIRGTGMATFADGSQQRLFFDVDNRFMKGEFVGLDGRMHHGTFGFT